MSLPVVLTPEAEQDYDEARDWYTANRPTAVGVRFADRIRTIFQRLATNPRYGRLVRDPVRQAVVPDFPYVIIYRPEPNAIVIISVFHTSRDPADWQGRVP